MARHRAVSLKARRTSILLSPQTYFRLHAVAADQGKPLSQVVEELMTPALEAAFQKASQRHHKPARPKATSAATGDRLEQALEVAAKIKAELKRRGISQAEFARALVVSASILNLWLNKRGIPQHELARVRRTLKEWGTTPKKP